MGDKRATQRDNNLHLDEIVTSQPELGPSIPEGGYGWVVFAGTLFFQALIPNLIVSFGIFLIFSKIENGSAANSDPRIWDDRFLSAPLFYAISRTFFDPATRSVILSSTWPRLVGTAGTCFTSAGILIMWMGMTGSHADWLFVPAGMLTGIGASLVMVQCDILLAQYFRRKLTALQQVSHIVQTIGFVLAPFMLGHNILNSGLYHIILWYQAIILQGLTVSLLFKKPKYNRPGPQSYLSINPPNDDEDITSKSRELQVTRQASQANEVTNDSVEPGPSEDAKPKWESFNEENETVSPSKWTKFDDDKEVVQYQKVSTKEQKSWERFDDDRTPDLINDVGTGASTDVRPTPLHVNNNTTYSYDDDAVAEEGRGTVFTFPQDHQFNPKLVNTLEYLKQPTFYKSLLMIVTNKYANFVFYVLFPTYLYAEVKYAKMYHLTALVATLSLVNLIFVATAHWVKVDKAKRPICLWICCWMGCIGYFMIAEYNTEMVLYLGAMLALLSMSSLEHVGKPLLGLTKKGEILSKDYILLTLFSGLSLLLFLLTNITFKDCFRLMGFLNFVTGSLWLGNYAYKKLQNK